MKSDRSSAVCRRGFLEAWIFCGLGERHQKYQSLSKAITGVTKSPVKIFELPYSNGRYEKIDQNLKTWANTLIDKLGKPRIIVGYSLGAIPAVGTLSRSGLEDSNLPTILLEPILSLNTSNGWRLADGLEGMLRSGNFEYFSRRGWEPKVAKARIKELKSFDKGQLAELVIANQGESVLSEFQSHYSTIEIAICDSENSLTLQTTPEKFQHLVLQSPRLKKIGSQHELFHQSPGEAQSWVLQKIRQRCKAFLMGL